MSLNKLLVDTNFLNRVAQAHSRSVMERLAIESQKWPNYDHELDEKLHYTAHYLLWHGIELKNNDILNKDGDELIKQGSEILEHLYTNADQSKHDTVQQLFNAALGYYISGYYARAYVLARDLTADNNIPQELELLKRLFMKDFLGVRELTFRLINNDDYQDSVIASLLRAGEISDDEAISRILHSTYNQAFSYFIEYPKTGREELIGRAIELSERGIQLSLTTRFVDWWWLFTCVNLIFREFSQNSFWAQLKPLIDDDDRNRVIIPYIKTNYRRRSPVIELWRSQTTALPYINDPKRTSYCLKMPTSAGKTRIAEIAILRLLLDTPDDPDAKCLYIAPFRSLAIEIEHSLQASFHPIGVRVSELYGGFELSPIERLIMERTRIVVATPEKIDAFLRYNPEFAKQVRLIIIDEGHIIHLSQRGIRYEMFLHRLTRRFSKLNTRILFISAVLPNTDEFAQWLTNDEGNVIQTNWRPSRQLIGELQWDGRTAKIEYRESDHKQLGYDCFVPNFITQIDVRGLKNVKTRRQKLFPFDIQETVAEAALRFARQGMTMIFCTQKRSTSPIARAVVEALKLQDDKFSLVSLLDKQGRERLKACVELAKETMGVDDEVVSFLENGIIVHHADIPKSLRIKLEELARSGLMRMVIASTTLAQGVNLPIQTVIVYGLTHGLGDSLKPVNFWNICGRAGRGMMENEGQVIFAVDLHKPDITLTKDKIATLNQREINKRIDYKRNKKIDEEKSVRDAIISGYHDYKLQSALRELVNLIVLQWKETHHSVDVIDLCQKLADNDISWVSDDRAKDIRTYLNWIDTELLALIEESETKEITPDFLQDLMANSLAVLQVGKITSGDERVEYIVGTVHARIQYIQSRLKDSSRRTKFYRLGFLFGDCELIEQQEDNLLQKIGMAHDFDSWTEAEQCEYIVGICTFLITLDALKPSTELPNGCWQDVLRLWLRGGTIREIADNPVIKPYNKKPSAIASYIDDMFNYKLPWGLNAITANISYLAEERCVILPEVVSYLSQLVKFGVHDPIASFILAFGVDSRRLALQIALLYHGSLKNTADILNWFLSLDEGHLERSGFNKEEIENIKKAQLKAGISEQNTAPPRTLDYTTRKKDVHSQVRPGEGLFMSYNTADGKDNIISFYTLSGSLFVNLRLNGPIPENWRRPENVETVLKSITFLNDDLVRCSISVSEV
jgi:superfamily II DNA/RNA helicase